MAKVATQGPLSSSALHFGGGPSKVGTAVKRKTPSELRGEQLKRKNVVELVGESSTHEIDIKKNNTGLKCGLRKPDSSKNPRYIDTRMDAVYPVRKNSSMIRRLSRKENVKQEHSVAEHNGSLKSCSVPSDSAAKSQPHISSLKAFVTSNVVSGDGMIRACKTAEKFGENTFRNVKELSSGLENLSGPETVDLEKALKGLIAHEPPPPSNLASDTSGKTGGISLENFCSEFHVCGQKSPLDLTLKTTMRVVSSSSVNWFHRLITCGAYGGLPQFSCTSRTASSGGQRISSSLELSSGTQIMNPVALHSWVYPQSSLPPSVISALTISAVEGAQMEFLDKRQSAWEDAFRNLYYMLRKRTCDIFYVCTAQFVVMFIGDVSKEEGKHACRAYMSKSTRSLRSLLREHDIDFSMPLCQSKVEQITTEDLVELSEMEKNNLGQIQRLASMSDVDNSPQSFLSFSGNENVHGLYDFLLNYRFLLTSLTGVDVPVLYSPVPFQNASLSSPEVRCKEVRRPDNISFSAKEFNMKDEPSQGSSAGFCYSVEIKDSYLPPWVISSVCKVMDSEGVSFEASFVTESTSIGLNVGLEAIRQKVEPQATRGEDLQEVTSGFFIPNTIFSPHLRSAFLKGLKYSNGSYTASISPV